MTANIPGARLRDVERRLALLKGPEAIDSFLAEHPNEVQVLQQMVEQRRAGKPVPSLARVQRVMLWSDGHLEFKTEAAPEGSGRPAERGGDRGRRGERGDRGGRGAGPATQGGGSAGRREGGGAPRPGGPPRSGGPAGPSRGRGGGPRGRGRSFGEDRGDRGLPRSGEGWVLLREGEKPPEPEPLPEYEWDEEEVGTPAAQESETPAADAAGGEVKSGE